MLHIVCYLTVIVLNLVWLCLGNGLRLIYQAAVPLATIAIAGIGVLLRLRTLPRPVRREYLQRALWALFLYYLLLASILLFFGGLFHMDRGWGGTVNLVPFHTIRNYLLYYKNTGSWVSVVNLLGNVLIMVPLGVLLPILLPSMRHVWTFVPLAALVSVGVEYLQWRTATGAADVDDSILNFFGAILGYCFVRVCQVCWAVRTNWKKPR